MEGLHPQPNEWTCGPFALKHALVTLGRLVSGERLAKQAGTAWWSGTAELGLAAAARKNDCELESARTRNRDQARRTLSAYLKRGIPVLLCVDDWEHWITVVRQDRLSFVIIDSNLDPVLDVVTWPQLERRWRYLDVEYDEDDPPILYDSYGVVPRFRVNIRADFSIKRVRHLRRHENRNLAMHWNTYVEDLLDVCRPPSNRTAATLSMAEFLRRNQELILSRVVYWHGDVERRSLVKLLANYRFVAEAYGLVIRASRTRRAVADIAILATMWAAASRGVGDMYGTGELTRR